MSRSGIAVSDRVFAYSIDRNDAIHSVSDNWLEFARANRASELTRESLIGHSLWKFICGRDTRVLYENLFARIRQDAATFELPFRCDSPDRFRFMQLTLMPGAGAAIHLRGVLIREQERPFYSILDRAFPRTESRLPMCSLCKRIYAYGSRWLELEDAVVQLELFGPTHLPELDYTVCHECRAPVERRPARTSAA